MERTPPAGQPADSSYIPVGDPTHLADYWGVISRRLWLVLVIFTVTTAAAIWAVARQPTLYQSYLTLQVNDPIEPARGLVNNPRITGLDIFVDPIVSEIELLKSSQVAEAVVMELGLRLIPADPDLVRSDLVGSPSVDPDAPPAAYDLVYDGSGTTVRLLDAEGTPLADGRVGESLVVPGLLSFTVQPAPSEGRTYGLRLVPRRSILGVVSGNLAAVPRENTNIIDVTYTSDDPVFADDILNAAATELRRIGADRVSRTARQDIQFIESQLDSVRQERAQAAAAIERFKTSRDFTTLTSREQTLVNRQQAIREDIDAVEREQSALASLAEQVAEQGPRSVDFPSVRASLPQSTNVEVISLIDAIRDQRSEVQRLMSEERLGAGHPRVRAAEGEVDQLGEDIIQAVNARLGVIQTEIGTLIAAEQLVRAQQQDFPNLEGQLRELERDRSSDDDVFEYLQGQLFQAQLRASASSAYVEVIDEAFGASPIEPQGQLNIVLGGLLGIILGIGAAFFLEYLDRTVRTSSDVEGLLGVPVLGIIPRLRRLDAEDDGQEVRQHGKGAPLVVALDPLDPAAEAYRNLRMNLMFMSTDDTPVRTVLFSSPGPDEGKSTTAVNFAVMLAQQGQRVLLVDADLRRPSLHRSLDLLREPGLTNLLIGDAELREAIRPNVLPNLDVLPSGPFPPNPSELLNSRTMEKLIDEFSGKYSQIIIDSPPILAVTDASVLAGHVDGAVIVLRSGETEQRAAERSVDQLRRLNVRILGAVLNEVAINANDDSYYMQYYYHYQPTHRGVGQRLRDSLTRVRFW